MRSLTSLLSLVQLLIIFFLTGLPIPIYSMDLDQKINDAFMPIAIWWENLVLTEIGIGIYNIPIILIILVGGALFFTFIFKFINIRNFGVAIQVVRGKYDYIEKHQLSEAKESLQIYSNEGDIKATIKDESEEGEVNHFQALTTAISGTVGLGNIAMVAVAISIGGPGATFWMILAGILGMSTKFVECTLGVKYRDINAQGEVHGGPMYYLSKGMAEIGFTKLGKILSIWFAIMCIGASFGGGNAFQSNQAAAQIINRFQINFTGNGTVIGFIFAILVGIVIIGGIKRIAKITEKIVPFMAGIYILAALFIIISHSEFIWPAIKQIISEAFTPRAGITGGFVAVLIQGLRRAAFSNEAGAGSAAIAHSAVRTKYAASEGLVALLEPFIDTVIICTLTALVIVIFNIDGNFIYGDVIDNEVALISGERIGGVNLTSMAFDNAIPGFSYVLAIAVILFAFSTILSWSYYGLQSWKYLFGHSKRSDFIFKIIFLCFTVLGSAITLDAVIKFSNAMILALVFPNMIGLMFLWKKVREEMDRFKDSIER